MSTTVSPETKLLRTLNRIQYCSSNGYSLSIIFAVVPSITFYFNN
ncbi:MAG: hypothetical protein Q8807_03835 ['Waltheria sp.' little leaf phytoplasma]|nr:hypothetical protein ['Waltheria sp.' little leaf phytoplasma]